MRPRHTLPPPPADGSGHVRGARRRSEPSRPSCVFVGFCEFDLERHAHTRAEIDKLMHYVCSSRYPGSRPATYEEVLFFVSDIICIVIIIA